MTRLVKGIMHSMNPQKRNRYLITGTSSGLGKYLHHHLGGIAFKREGSRVNTVDIIIHCAFNSKPDLKSLKEYFQQNTTLTNKITQIPHKKFIFISSVDIYPKNAKKHTEKDEDIDINKIKNPYGEAKFISEYLVKKNCSNFLILRCSALLGKDSRRNSLIKIIEDKNPIVTVSEKSVFNYIFHSDVLDFIKLAVEKDLQGIFNLASSKNITMKQIAKLFKKKIRFGDYLYNVGNIDNSKSSSIFTAFKKTSREIILDMRG